MARPRSADDDAEDDDDSLDVLGVPPRSPDRPGEGLRVLLLTRNLPVTDLCLIAHAETPIGIIYLGRRRTPSGPGWVIVNVQLVPASAPRPS